MKENFPKEHIPVFLHVSNEYAPMCAVTMASILYNTQQHIDFYIIETGITDFNKKQIENLSNKFNNFSVEWIAFKYNDIFKKDYFLKIKKGNLHHPEWPGIHSFCTPFIPLLKQEINKAIYIDTDVIFLDDITLFYNEDISNYALGVVPDVVCPLFVSKKQKDLNKNIPYSEFGTYFCAGVLLINCEFFRNNNLINDYFKITKEQVVPVCDQDVLNILLKNKCKMLDQKFDVIYQPNDSELALLKTDIKSDVFKKARKECVIRHFADAKPWAEPTVWCKEIYMHDKWYFFAELTPFKELINEKFPYLKSTERLTFKKKLQHKLLMSLIRHAFFHRKKDKERIKQLKNLLRGYNV